MERQEKRSQQRREREKKRREPGEKAEGKGEAQKREGKAGDGGGKDRVTEPREERGLRYSGEPAVPMLQNCSNKSTGERAQEEHLARE